MGKERKVKSKGNGRGKRGWAFRFSRQNTPSNMFFAEIFGPNKEVTPISPRSANRADVVLECAWLGNGYFVFPDRGRCDFLI